jgi:hypothetical protein
LRPSGRFVAGGARGGRAGRGRRHVGAGRNRWPLSRLGRRRALRRRTAIQARGAPPARPRQSTGMGPVGNRAFLIDPGQHRPTGRLDEGSSTRNRKVVGSNPTSGAHRSSSGLERWLASLRGGRPSGHRGARWLAGRGRHRRHHQSREAAPPRPDGPSPRAACSLSSDLDCFASGLPEPLRHVAGGGAGLSHGKVLPCLESRTPEPRRMP